MDELYKSLLSIISASDLIKKWSLPASELEKIVSQQWLTPYILKEKRQNKDGFIYYLCELKANKSLYREIWFDIDSEEFDVDGVVFDSNEISAYEIKNPYLCDKLIDNSGSLDSEWMSAHEARVVVGMTPKEFVSLLNSGALETDREQDRQDFAKLNGIDINKAPFFIISDLDSVRVHKASFTDYTTKLYVGKKIDDRILKYYSNECINNESCENMSPESIYNTKITIQELEAAKVQAEQEIESLKQRLAEFEAAKAAQEPIDQNDKPRTASATEAAQASRVEEWKRYAVVMAKIAYDCGREDRKQVTRSEYMTLAKRHGELSKQALELLRNALPEGVTNTSGGASKQG